MNVQLTQLLSQCPSCRSAYREASIVRVAEQGRTKTYHCSCLTCGQAMLAVVLESSGWVSAIGCATDLQGHEAERLLLADPIDIETCMRGARALLKHSKHVCQILFSGASPHS